MAKRPACLGISALVVLVVLLQTQTDADNEDSEIRSVCNEFPEAQVVAAKSRSDAIDDCWECCAVATDSSKELTGYHVDSDHRCLCTHARKTKAIVGRTQ